MSEEHIVWANPDLKVSILQVLHTAKQRKAGRGGASGKMLMDCLGAALLELEQTLRWLLRKNYINVGDRMFVITDDGVEYLSEQSGPGQPPPDSSRVPRRPLPTAGAGSIALPLPDSSDEP